MHASVSGQLLSVLELTISYWSCQLPSSGDDKINLAGGLNKFVTDVSVRSNGECRWSGPATFKVNCEMKINRWPFDQQLCQLSFGSFTYGERFLKIKLFRARGQITSKYLLALCMGAHYLFELVGRISQVPMVCISPAELRAFFLKTDRSRTTNLRSRLTTIFEMNMRRRVESSTWDYTPRSG